MPRDSSAKYQAQDSRQTLSAALEEYYALNLGRVQRPSNLPAESARLFLCHDICHVIFGLTTSLADEAMVDARTLLSTDVGPRRYAHYLAADPQAQKLFKELGWLRAVAITLAVLPRIARAAMERLRMRRPWPWSPPPAFMDRSLEELRREFRIRVM
jgi:hypothetical protein